MKYIRHLSAIAILTLLAACGGGGGGNSSGGAAPTPPVVAPPLDPAPPVVPPVDPPPVTPDRPDFLTRSDLCEHPRTGNQPSGLPYYDKQGTLNDELRWLRSFVDESYLWYREVPALNMADYKTPTDYFAALKTPLVTASGRAKDRFHFTYPSQVWDELSGAGVALGYGITWSRGTGATARVWNVTLVEPGTPAAAAGVRRGDLLATVDGIDIADTSAAATALLNAGLFPVGAGETHQLVLQRGGVALPAVSLQSRNIAMAPVQNTKVLGTPTGAVGYLQFGEHNAVAERQLVDAFSTLKAAKVTDLVLDMRYNGGGYLVIASELAYMVAGPAATDGKFFERLQPNDKRPPGAPEPFLARSLGMVPAALADGVALPYLGLKRVTVLTTAGTCSASESVINSLRGVDVEVNLIGGETCGKPYAFVPQPNCGTTYFTIQLQAVNNKGFGDYADGFQPTCKADDDLGHALGDPSERLLATALSYRANGVCPATPLRGRALDGGGAPRLVRPEAKEISILGR